MKHIDIGLHGISTPQQGLVRLGHVKYALVPGDENHHVLSGIHALRFKQSFEIAAISNRHKAPGFGLPHMRRLNLGSRKRGISSKPTRLEIQFV